MSHDSYLAGYRRYLVRLRCCDSNNEECEWAGDGELEEEYGQSWSTPEECPVCHGQLEVEGEADGPDYDVIYDRMKEESFDD